MSAPVTLELLRDGSVARVALARPPRNLLDTEAVEALTALLPGLAARAGLRLVVFDGEGDHFSFGASVPEHLPDRVGRMLPTFHALFGALEATGLPTAAAVRGRCLGGAAELVTWCGTVHATPGAAIGFPEIRLGVFPPVAAVALRLRVSPALATRMVLTGVSLSGEEARAAGLVDAVADDPLASLLAWHDDALAALSPASLRFAWRASRRPWREAVERRLPAAERLYLDELMAHPDATEGLLAFTEKRAPRWSTP